MLPFLYARIYKYREFRACLFPRRERKREEGKGRAAEEGKRLFPSSALDV